MKRYLLVGACVSLLTACGNMGIGVPGGTQAGTYNCTGPNGPATYDVKSVGGAKLHYCTKKMMRTDCMSGTALNPTAVSGVSCKLQD